MRYRKSEDFLGGVGLPERPKNNEEHELDHLLDDDDEYWRKGAPVEKFEYSLFDRDESDDYDNFVVVGDD